MEEDRGMSYRNVIDQSWTAAHPLPSFEKADNKEERGRVLAVGGSPETPGSLLLAGEGALRAGAGKVRLATDPRVAPGMALAFPEARVMSSFSIHGLDELQRQAADAAVILAGPGALDSSLMKQTAKRLLPIPRTLMLDALALFSVDLEEMRGRSAPIVLSPNPSEAASMLGVEQGEVESDPLEAVQTLVARSGAVVALRGRDTLICSPDGRLLENRQGCVGLATAGSGDALAGITAGLLARGTEPFEAVAWGVYLHARAGDRLARRVGFVGFLAREILREVPALLEQASGADQE